MAFPHESLTWPRVYFSYNSATLHAGARVSHECPKCCKFQDLFFTPVRPLSWVTGRGRILDLVLRVVRGLHSETGRAVKYDLLSTARLEGMFSPISGNPMHEFDTIGP